MDSITLSDIAENLLGRKTHRTVLFLGAKAGGFFENEDLYTTVKEYSTVEFDVLSSEQKFQTCYQILENFSERDRDSVLSQSLSTKSGYRLEDDYLSELIAVDFFDAVISTNIDLLLEDALRRERVRELRDYQLLIYGKTPTKDILPCKHDFLLKIFGDLESKYYKTAGDEFPIEDDEDLREFLEHTLDSHVLMVGYDPVWDGPLDKAFFMKGGELIYVNDEPLGVDSFIARVIERRKGKCLIGGQGVYKRFMRDLHALLFERGPLGYEAMHKVSRQLQQILDEIALLHKAVQNIESRLELPGDTN